MRDLLFTISLTIFIALIGYLVLQPAPSYGPYMVKDYSCNGDECRVTLHTNETATVYRAVIIGDELCYTPRSIPKWWFCSDTRRRNFEQLPVIELSKK